MSTIPSDDPCLTPEERRIVDAAWRAFLAALQPVGDVIEQQDAPDCAMLYNSFLKLATNFEALEREIMRAQQIRLLHAAQERSSGS